MSINCSATAITAIIQSFRSLNTGPNRSSDRDRIPNQGTIANLNEFDKFLNLRVDNFCLLGSSYLFLCYGWVVGDTTRVINEDSIIERSQVTSRVPPGGWAPPFRLEHLINFYCNHYSCTVSRSFYPDILVYGSSKHLYPVPLHVALKSNAVSEGQPIYTSKLGLRGPLIAHYRHGLTGGSYGEVIGGLDRRI